MPDTKVIDVESEKALGRIKVGQGAGLLELSRDGTKLFVCLEKKNKVLAIEVSSPGSL